jgi:hypothetical protein
MPTIQEWIKQIEGLEKENAILNGILNISTFNSLQCDYTNSPFWIIVEPKQILKKDAEQIASCVTGIFFSRESAQQYLDAHCYNFADNTIVYGCAGHHNDEYWQAIKNGKKAVFTNPE